MVSNPASEPRDVEAIRKALDNVCDCGTEIYRGPVQQHEAGEALDRLEARLTALEAERERFRDALCNIADYPGIPLRRDPGRAAEVYRQTALAALTPSSPAARESR